jgi:hypothetical protein
MIPTPTKILTTAAMVAAVLTIIVGIATLPMRGVVSAAIFVAAGVFLYLFGSVRPRHWTPSTRATTIVYFSLILVAQSAAA